MQEVSLYGKYSLLQDDAYQKLGQDSVLLADFMSFRRGSHVCDFGAGIGVLSVLAAAKDETIRLSAVELIPGAAALCEENLRRNGFAARSEVLACDLRDLRGRIPPSSIDAVVTNPPYFTRVSGYSSGSETRAAARTDDTSDIGALCRAAADVLKWGGRFFTKKANRRPFSCSAFTAQGRSCVCASRFSSRTATAGKAPNTGVFII